MAKADPDYDPKTKTYSKAHNEKKYRKQREDAEAKAAKGDKGALKTAESIYRKKDGGSAKTIGKYNKETSDLSEKYAKATDAHSKARGEAADVGSEMAEDYFALRGGKMGGAKLGGMAKGAASNISNAVKNSAKALGSWGKGAARTGTEDAEKAVAKTVERPRSNAVKRDDDGAPIRTEAQKAQKAADAAPKAETKPTAAASADKTEAQAAVKGTDKGGAGKKAADDVQAASKAQGPAVKSSKTTVKVEGKPAESSSMSATDKFKAAAKGDAKKAAWKEMSRDEQKAYQAGRPAKTETAPKSDTPAADSDTKTVKKTQKGRPPKAAEASTDEVDFNKMSDSELAAYRAKAPKDAKGRTLMTGSSDASAPASTGGGKGYLKEKFRQMKAAKAAAETDAASDASKDNLPGFE